MNRTELRTKFDEVRVWKTGEKRAPHKPLVLLYTLARCSRNEDRLIRFSDVEDKLNELLREFGSHQNPRAQYPFWRLQNDGVWEFTDTGGHDPGKDPPMDFLRSSETRAGFTPEVYSLLVSDRELLNEVAAALLEEHFTEAYDEDILDAIGMHYSPLISRARDPEFRERILRAYDFRCAVCGYDGRLRYTPLAIEAAHIKWHKAGGPDTEPNGLSLCSMHHKMLDRGAFTLRPDATIVVSENVTGGPALHAWLTRFHDSKAAAPKRTEYQPQEDYIEWHWAEVFQKPEMRI